MYGSGSPFHGGGGPVELEIPLPMGNQDGIHAASGGPVSSTTTIGPHVVAGGVTIPLPTPATKDGWMFLSDYEKDLIDNARMRLFDGHDECMATGNPFDQPGSWDNGEWRIKKFCDEIFCKKEEDMLYHEFKWIFEKINTGQTHIKNP